MCTCRLIVIFSAWSAHIERKREKKKKGKKRKGNVLIWNARQMEKNEQLFNSIQSELFEIHIYLWLLCHLVVIFFCAYSIRSNAIEERERKKSWISRCFFRKWFFHFDSISIEKMSNEKTNKWMNILLSLDWYT